MSQAEVDETLSSIYMTIKKYLHSCLLIEENGKRLLIDPGSFSFVEGKLTPKDIGPVDVIVYTHKHADHIDLGVLKELLAIHAAIIVTHEDVGEMLQSEGIAHERIEVGSAHMAEGFMIEAFTAPHDPIPAEIPHNLAFLINKTVLHPGDSLHVEGVDHVDVLALPTAAPWLRAVDVIEFAKNLSPKIVIPIHDAFIKDFMLERMYSGMFPPHFLKAGIEFRPLSFLDELSI